jgi:ABC-type phosphate transport system permease subunit
MQKPLCIGCAICADTLNGVPSIVMGVFVYGILFAVQALQRAGGRHRWGS